MNKGGTGTFAGQGQLGSSQHHSSSSYSTNTQRMQHSPGSVNGGGSLHHNGMGDIARIPRPQYDPYLDSLKSPLIKDDSDGKSLRLRCAEQRKSS